MVKCLVALKQLACVYLEAAISSTYYFPFAALSRRGHHSLTPALNNNIIYHIAAQSKVSDHIIKTSSITYTTDRMYYRDILVLAKCQYYFILTAMVLI